MTTLTTFTNSTGITLADLATEHQTLSVTGLRGTISEVDFVVTGLTHTFPADLDFLLVGPDGVANLEFWSDAGGSFPLSDATVTVAYASPLPLPFGAQINSSSSYHEGDYGEVETASNWSGLTIGSINHAETNGFSGFGSVFALPGLSANGTWTLWVADDHAGDSGSLSSWSLKISTVDHAPVISSDGGGNAATLAIAENTTAVTTVTAHDSDPDGIPLTFSITGGSDQTSFQIDSGTGALSFVSAPDFENPTDSDHNNSYVVQVHVSDGELNDTQTINRQCHRYLH